MSAIRASMPVPRERARRYRDARWWDDRLLGDGIEAAAARSPDAVAVADRERSLSCAELARLVAAGVAMLAEHRVRARDAVVLIAGNTAEGVIAYHSLLRAGATAVLLDRHCGPADVRCARDAAGSDAIAIAPAAERERLRDALADTAVLPLERFGRTERADEPGLSWTEPPRDEPAVVVSTSGTTRRPKAVIHSLNTLTAGARNMARITGADRASVVFLVSPLTTIAGVMQMHLVADLGATLVLEDRFDPEATLDRINACGATLLGGAPVIAERLLRAAAARSDRRIALRTLALGGAMLPLPLLELATDAFGIEVARVYGSSEAPNSSGSLQSDPRSQRLADDGVLMPGTEVRVGSKEHAREGLVRGPAVFLGYVDPADTEAVFEDGWYRTGDAVELHADRLTVIGRLEEVVNRNGLKIALSEVEGALAGLPGVVEYACFGSPDTETGERLAVAVRPGAGHETNLDGVLAHLRKQGLAARKLPEQLVIWDQPLPRTASGKIIRSRLAMESAGRTVQLAARLRRGDRI